MGIEIMLKTLDKFSKLRMSLLSYLNLDAIAVSFQYNNPIFCSIMKLQDQA